MKIYQGISVSTGIAIGEALIFDNQYRNVRCRLIQPDLVDTEIARLDSAVQFTYDQIAQNQESVSKAIGEEYGRIFGAHLKILIDNKLIQAIKTHISQDYYCAEYAVALEFDRCVEVFNQYQQGNFAERANDFKDIRNRLLSQLTGIRLKDLSHLERSVILLAGNLTPSETSNLDRSHILGFATEEGGRGSHTAIVAGAMQIPAVLGIGAFLKDLQSGDQIILDGTNGLLIISPDADTARKYEEQYQFIYNQSLHFSAKSGSPAITQDGTEIRVYGNIEFPFEAPTCDQNGAAGIGLYRTEFLYLTNDEGSLLLPTEEDHFDAYKEVVEEMKERPTTIRTFDLGADKLPSNLRLSSQIESNPFLGVRSIRLSLKNTSLFRTQLRAIARASAFGKIRLMFPLVSTIMEFRQAKMIFRDVCEELAELGVPYDPDIPIGMMLEVPAAVIMMESFVQEADFFSVGTNDLAQYTLAVDRANKEVGALYNSEDPAVLRLVQRAIHIADIYDKPISLCGQMCSDPNNTMFLIGLGLRHFSVSPSTIPTIKEICRQVSVKQCQELSHRVFRMETAHDIRGFLKLETSKILGTEDSSKNRNAPQS